MGLNWSSRRIIVTLFAMTTPESPLRPLAARATGDAQLGGPMAEALGLPRDTARVLATELITGRIAAFWAEQEAKGIPPSPC